MDGELGLQNKLHLKKRRPTCARCRNHGMILDVKGHKKHCEYRTCECSRCKVVAQRRQVVAKQVAMNRQQEKDVQKREQERQQLWELYEDLPESQRFYQDVPVSVTAASPDISEHELVIDEDHVPLSNSSPVHSSLSEEAKPEDYLLPNNDQSIGEHSMHDSLAPNCYPEPREKEVVGTNASQAVCQRPYITMKDYAYQHFETSAGASYGSGICIQSDQELPSTQCTEAMANHTPPVNLYQNCEDQTMNYPPPLPCPVSMEMAVPEQVDSPPLDLEVSPPPPMMPYTSVTTLPSCSYSYVGRPFSRQNRPQLITLPRLDESRESTYSTPCSSFPSYPVSYDPYAIASMTITGNTYTSTQMYDQEHQYSNYPSPTLPTQSTPVFTFPPPTNPSDTTMSFFFSNCDHVGEDSLPEENTPKEADLYESSIQETRQGSQGSEYCE